jgi:hypothetical protein
MLIEVLHHWRYVLNCTPVRSNGGVANFYEKDSQGPGEATLDVMSWSIAGEGNYQCNTKEQVQKNIHGGNWQQYSVATDAQDLVNGFFVLQSSLLSRS